MPFLRWFRRKPKTSDYPVMVPWGDKEIDLFPFAEEVIHHAPDDPGMDAIQLAELAQVAWNGSYIHVGRYPQGVDRSYARVLIQRVGQWARWPERERAKNSPIFKCARIKVGSDPCPTMLAKAGTIVGLDQITRLPREDCWRHCGCHYDYLTKVPAG